MKKPIRLAALTAAAVIALTGCASGSNAKTAGSSNGTTAGSSNETSTTFQKKDPLIIGYSAYDLQSPYWQAYAAGIKAEADTSNGRVIVADAKSSQQAQVSGSADLINQKISALIISPVQPSSLPVSITAAHAAHIPVIIGDNGAVGNYDAYILSENKHGGELAAQYIIDSFKGKPGPHKVGVMELETGKVVGDERVAGFTDTLKANSDFQLVASLNAHNTVDGGFKVAKDMLSANPDLVAIYCADDPEAQGASRALIASGKDPSSNFVLVGFNGDPPALDLIEQGKQTATIAQDAYGQGKIAVQAALALLNGDHVGYTDAATKTILFPVQVVDSKNLADFRSSLANRK